MPDTIQDACQFYENAMISKIFLLSICYYFINKIFDLRKRELQDTRYPIMYTYLSYIIKMDKP